MNKGNIYINCEDTMVVSLGDTRDTRFRGLVVKSKKWPVGTDYDGFNKEGFKRVVPQAQILLLQETI